MDTLIKAWRNGLAFAGLLLITLGLAACGGGGGGESAPTSYTLGGTLSGLADNRSITLQLNGGNDLTLDATANGKPYSFATTLAVGSPYAVTIPAQPPQHHCTISNASGTVAADTVVDITCTAFPITAAGLGLSLAIKGDGTLWAWGYNNNGQLGLGDNEDRLAPAQVGSASDWSAVSAASASYHVLALKSDGSLWAWGDNSSGQLGLADLIERNVPVRVGTASDWAAVSAGGEHSLALKADGTLWGWGYNSNGQLGLGEIPEGCPATSYCDIPRQIGSDADWAAVSAGTNHTLALRADGSLWAWGSNTTGQLGLGDTANRSSPVQVSSTSDWVAVSAGDRHSMALKTNGTLWGFGYNEGGQLGLGHTADSSTPQQEMTNATDWVAVSAGGDNTLARKADGTLWAWGTNGNGELGLGAGAGTYIHTPQQVGVDTDWHSVTAGYYHTLAVKADGSLRTWGDNSDGGLGLGLMARFLEPTQLVTGADWASVSAGTSHTLALKADGTLWAWGSNNSGQLGLDDTDTRYTPTRVGSDTWLAVSAGYGDFSLGIQSDGTLWAWGSNTVGRLGLGDSVDRHLPTQIGMNNGWVAVSAGTNHSLAIRQVESEHTLWAWGYGASGQLGLGDTISHTTPQQVGIETNWGAVSAGGWDFSLGIQIDGTLWAWGWNNSGQLGLGDYAQRTSPQQVIGKTWSQVSTGPTHSLAIDDSGALYAWGGNDYGELGLGDMNHYTVPTQVGGAVNWSALADRLGNQNSFAIQDDGTLWAWGTNVSAQIGFGNSMYYNVPQQVGLETDWATVSAGVSHTVALTSGNVQWGWGRNSFGQLGVRTAEFDEPQVVPGW